MIVRDGWISTNIRQRLEHRNLDFSVCVKPTRARVMTFADATVEAATELGKKPVTTTASSLFLIVRRSSILFLLPVPLVLWWA